MAATRMQATLLLAVSCCLFASTADAGLFGFTKTTTRRALLETRGGSTAETTANPSCCWIASQSVPKSVRDDILKQVSPSLTIVQPNDCWEAVSAAHDQSVILFRPDAVDLQRGEGLWTMLGPVMERILADQQQKHGSNTALCVLAPNDIQTVKSRLEEAAVRLIPFLANQRDGISTLQHVFSNVSYVSSPQEAITVCTEMNQASKAVAISSSPSFIKTAPATTSKLIHPPMTPANLAAARRLGVDARRQVDETLDKVRRACTTDNGEVKMVANFGELCRASLKQAKLKGLSPIETSDVAKQMQTYVHSSLEYSLADLYDQQLALLEEACFQEFRQKLSNLKISPNLPSDMAKLTHDAVAKFTKVANRMAPPGAKKASSTLAFRRRLTEYVSARLLKAKASNKFRPVPRKGITVGFHWLLPKPFGNDYRQEPWKIHATDNMVYVPSALADVNPDQVKEGTWRDAIVPLPSGKDMLYMQ